MGSRQPDQTPKDRLSKRAKLNQSSQHSFIRAGKNGATHFEGRSPDVAVRTLELDELLLRVVRFAVDDVIGDVGRIPIDEDN